jgi:hypothetical protein
MQRGQEVALRAELEQERQRVDDESHWVLPHALGPTAAGAAPATTYVRDALGKKRPCVFAHGVCASA